MRVALDGENLFDEPELKIGLGSIEREQIERTVAGLDGVLSIDLGCRGRKIMQAGVLRGESQAQVEKLVGAISAYIDGNTHTLVTGSGKEFGNLRMDVFKVSKERSSGSGVCCDYEIAYTQLAV
jgi:hypothetical protein